MHPRSPKTSFLPLSKRPRTNKSQSSNSEDNEPTLTRNVRNKTVATVAVASDSTPRVSAHIAKTVEINATDDESSSSSSSSSTPDEIFAFESALRADMENGKSISEAVSGLFSAVNDTTKASKGNDLSSPNIAAPILEALNDSPHLAADVQAVAQMCYVIYQITGNDPFLCSRSRPRLSLEINNLRDVASIIERSKSIVVLTGAGVSVSCGIPDFRSKGGLYDKVRKTYGLAEPETIFDLYEFQHDPSLFYSFAKQVMPHPSLKPSKTHAFVAELHARGKLLRNYSQNIDGLESRAGVPNDRLILCHGSFLSATCNKKKCASQVPGSAIVNDVLSGIIPKCKACLKKHTAELEKQKSATFSTNESDDEDEDDENESGIGVMKPDIVFFGESLPTSVSDSLEEDVEKADLVLVLGTSLQVHPVARIPHYFDDSVPRILINRELVPYDFDIELLGYCDTVVQQLRTVLGWHDKQSKPSDILEKEQAGASSEENGLNTSTKKSDKKDEENVEFIAPRRFLFAGAASHVMLNKNS